MSDLIKEYYEKAHTFPVLVGQKLAKFESNPDIKAEFEYWIETKQYATDGVSVEGYTARSISELSPYLNGEGAFALLIELRDDPNKAKKRIAAGFKKK